MGTRKEFEFAEVMVNRLLLESFSLEKSAYHITSNEKEIQHRLDKYRGKLRYHISRSLSPRQREVIQYYLTGKKEREIADILGITQQVVNIYKQRAIKKLCKIIVS